jgi:glucose-6-phosphate 1-dehydrogenase
MTQPISRVKPFDYVVFGGTGDLALRKLLPALYQRDRDEQLPDSGRIIAVSHTPLTGNDYRSLVENRLRSHLGADEFEPAVWERFQARIEYAVADALSDSGWNELASLFGDDAERVRVFYLATSPNLFGPICERLKAAGLVTDRARVVLEKPIGRDLASARQINEEVGAVFDEPQIFRIDHYLGKETVQNLLALRFANSLFEPLWRSSSIDHVQITVAETIGIETRGNYYDQSGALRDMVQNHLLQLLCLVAMEPPVSLDKEAVRDEKIKVLNSLVPITVEDIGLKTVRGQYRSGAVGSAPVQGYLEETGVAANSVTETFVSLALGGRAVLLAHRQAHAGKSLGNRHPVPRGAAPGVPHRCRRDRAQQAGHPPAARRAYPPAPDGQGTRSGRAAPAVGGAQSQLRRNLPPPLPRCL